MTDTNELPEEWRPIPGYESLYLISSHGRVARIETQRQLAYDWAGRKHFRYRSVRLYGGDGSRQHLVVHKLVYLAFHGEIPFGMQVDHKDHNRFNNHYSNLQLTTHEENQARRKKYIEPTPDNGIFETTGVNL